MNIYMCAGLLNNMNVGWRQDIIQSTGVSFVRKLTRALWYLDPHHSKLNDRSFTQFQGYNDFRRRKEKELRLSVSGLDEHIKVVHDVYFCVCVRCLFLKPFVYKFNYILTLIKFLAP